MRFDYRFAAVLIFAGACTTDDGATGRGGMTSDDSQGEQSDDAINKPTSGMDAKAPKPSSDGGGDVASDDGSVDASRPGEDASRPGEVDASTDVDASSTEVDAGSTTEVDAGGKRCGTRGGIECKQGEFCDFGDADDSCGGLDKGGTCKPMKQACTKEYAPVCGCDGRSYGNACTAHSAGVSVKHKDLCTRAECEGVGGTVKASTGADNPKCGAGQEWWPISGGLELGACCRPKKGPATVCGGIAGFPCGADQFCNYEEGQGCEIADGTGKCEPKPDFCTLDYKPVCGCDGNTYSNGCSANGAGVSVKSRGACQ